MISFVIGKIFVIALFVGPLLGLALIGFVLGRMLRLRGLAIILPAIAIAAFAGWFRFAYSAFESACRSAPAIEFIARPAQPPRGLAYEGSPAPRPVLQFSSRQLVEQQVVEYLDEEGGRRICLGAPSANARVRREITHDCGHLKELQSLYVLKVIAAKPLPNPWNHPLHRYELRIEDKTTGKVIAAAPELVFGGGVLGFVMRVARGDPDYQYLSCGYVDKGIDTWRPNLSTRPQYERYVEKDMAFVRSALGIQ